MACARVLPWRPAAANEAQILVIDAACAGHATKIIVCAGARRRGIARARVTTVQIDAVRHDAGVVHRAVMRVWRQCGKGAQILTIERCGAETASLKAAVILAVRFPFAALSLG